MRNNSEKGQIIVLMGVILTVTVVLVAAISANLANIGVGTLRTRSKALAPEFINLRSRFGEILNYNINQYENIPYSFQKTCSDFYLLEIQYGNFFQATLNQYGYGGDTFSSIADPTFQDHCNVFFMNVSLSLDDGTTCITEENVVFSILYVRRT